ncbi:Rmf/CrpP family protein [Kitasatospora sp. NPDC088548]|uniref:Rmf/CrpP family protein n=1 Tax=Kitasatospora sp. NPDC088548 TaxID=3364075 RepID=UPI00381E5CD3
MEENQGLSRQAALGAAEEGAAAALAGQKVENCPHSEDGDLTTRWLRRWWVSGFEEAATTRH